MTLHGNPELAGFSNRPHVPAMAQCGQRPSATPRRVRFPERTARIAFDMRAFAIN
ncbi:MAG: hypothetical protein QOJ04_6765 [Caballeronia sp.]|jgi:hypothetical protein|nr:hypothetical protein [Caballeronia sp.]